VARGREGVVATPFCHYHPDRETNVTCGRCGRPLCPDCVQHGATGVRCAECIRPSPRALGLATREQIVRAGVAALAVGAAGGALLGLVGWVDLFSGLLLGFAVGSAAFLVGQRHRDAAIQGTAGLAALAGLLLAAVIASLGASHGGIGGIARVAVGVPYASFILPAVAAIAGAIIRFLL